MKKQSEKYNSFQIIDKIRYLKLSIRPVELFTGLSYQIDESFLLLHPIYKKQKSRKTTNFLHWSVDTYDINYIFNFVY